MTRFSNKNYIRDKINAFEELRPIITESFPYWEHDDLRQALDTLNSYLNKLYHIHKLDHKLDHKLEEKEG